MKQLVLFFIFSLFTIQYSLAQPGTIQLHATGQTTSYYPGDDGDLQMGVPLPANRFLDQGNGSAIDVLTGLMWVLDGNLVATKNPEFDQDRTSGDGDIDWQTALDYVALLNTENYLGYNDWRMPNLVEIRSLADLSGSDTALPSGHPFFNLKPLYWSSTTSEDIRALAAGCFITNYLVHSNTTNIAGETEMFNKRGGMYPIQYWKFYFLPVRTASLPGEVQLPGTGQRYNFYPGDDGGLKKGTPWPSPRLLDNKDESVSDRLTGLMWTKDANLMLSRDPDCDTLEWLDGYVTWEMALDYIAKLNNENWLGYNDWRLPNRNEMTSLLDFAFDRPVLPERFPFINTGEYGGLAYWTSTTLSGEPNRAWVVETYDGMMEDGNNNGYQKNNGRAAWPVRSDTNPLPEGAISGTITLDGNPYPRAEILLEGPIDAFIRSNLNGEYEFTGLPDGNYIIKPEHKYARFEPAYHSVNISNNQVTCDFDAAYTRAYGWVDMSENLFKIGDAAGAIFYDLYFIGNEGWVVNGFASNEIYHTTDGGETWEVQETGVPCNAIQMLSNTEGYAAGGSGVIHKTTNGGGTWEYLGFTPSKINAITFSDNGDIGYACGIDGWITKIVGGEIFPEQVTGTTDWLSIDVTPSGNYGWATACFGRKAIIENGLWTYYGGAMYFPCYNDVQFVNESMMWMAYDDGIVRKIGDDFQNVYKEETSAYQGVFVLNEDTVWAVSNRGDIILTVGGSEDTVHWSYDNIGKEYLIDVFAVDGYHAWAVGSNGSFFRYGLLEGFPAGGAEILDFVVDQQVHPATINNAERTIHVKVINGTDLTQIIPEIFISAGATIDPAGGIMQDFTSVVIYNVTSENGQTINEWKAFVELVDIAENPDPFEVLVYPNPAIREVRIRYQISDIGYQIFDLYEISGLKIRGLVNELKMPGIYEEVFDVSDLPAGVYFIRFVAGEQVVTKKLLVN